MKERFGRRGLISITVLLMAVVFSLTIAPPVKALDLNPANYFSVTYEPVVFDKAEVTAGEVFHIIIKGRATCTKGLPLPISEAYIASRVIARPYSGGPDLLLDPEYIIAIKPVPRKAGETYDINLSVSLAFPSGSKPDSYFVIGELIEAKVKVLVWMGVTGSFPKESSMGTVKCILPQSEPPPEPPPAPAPEPVSSISITPLNPSDAAPMPPTPGTNYDPDRTADPPSSSFPIFAGIIIAIAAIILIAFVIIMIKRHTT